ncbi:MAG: hypothetical protein M3Q50_11375 [Chloroflexota bacterium]|nr:hypothetical protein [Chloroflexia bacterium]MDQ3227217.1 hypothetical protein [Chloroflexota bacterium]
MTQTPAESATFYRQLAASVQNPPGVHLFVIPPYTSLGAVSEVAGQPPHRIIDGLFVGRAAWTVEGFIATYQAGYEGVTVIG